MGLTTTLAGLSSPAYIAKVLRYGPIAYWPLTEQSGTTAYCRVNSAQNGTYKRDVSTMGTVTGIDGNTAPDFTAGSDYVDIYSAALNTAYNKDLGTALIWCKVSGSGIWTDSTERFALCVSWGVFVEYLRLSRASTNNDLGPLHRRDGGNYTATIGTGGDLNWFLQATTWTAAGNVTTFHYNTTAGTPSTCPAAADASALDSTRCTIGTRFLITMPNAWDGPLQHCVIFDKVLSKTEIDDLAAV